MKQWMGITLGFVLSVPAAAGDVYRWVGDRGEVCFGDRPPHQAQAMPQPMLPTGSDVSPEDGLRSGERARLHEIERRESREAAERNARAKLAAAEEKRRARQVERDAQRCADYRHKIRDYQRKLRAGCRVSTCNTYQASIDSYQDKVARVCR